MIPDRSHIAECCGNIRSFECKTKRSAQFKLSNKINAPRKGFTPHRGKRSRIPESVCQCLFLPRVQSVLQKAIMDSIRNRLTRRIAAEMKKSITMPRQAFRVAGSKKGQRRDFQAATRRQMLRINCRTVWNRSLWRVLPLVHTARLWLPETARRL